MQHTAAILAIGEQQAGAVHRRQLLAAGIDDEVVKRHLHGGVLIRRGPHVFSIVGVPPSVDQRLWCALLTAQRTAVVSHRSAARLHGLGRFRDDQLDIVEVGDPPHQLVGATRHRSTHVSEHHRTLIRGIPVTTIPRTIFDLAGQVSRKRRRRGMPWLYEYQVARTLDDAIGSGVPVALFEAILSEIGGRGRGGTVVMRQLLSTRGEGYVATDSELEDLVHAVLTRFGLPLPVRQRNLGGLKDRTGRVDFLFADHAVVIEADGRKNHTALMDREHDAWRDLELAAAGFRVIRVTWTQLTDDPHRFVQALRSVLGRVRA